MLLLSGLITCDEYDVLEQIYSNNLELEVKVNETPKKKQLEHDQAKELDVNGGLVELQEYR
jgi:hypothetical protein